MEIAIIVVAAIIAFMVLKAVLHILFRVIGIAAIAAFVYFIALPYAHAHGLM